MEKTYRDVERRDWNQRSGAAALAGRILLAFIFLASGLSKIPGFDATVGYMASRGVPAPDVLLYPAIFIEVIAGLLLLLGYKSRGAATALLLYLIPVTLIFHAFWALGGMDRQMQLINFMKNLAIMGGLLQVVANGAGVASIDYVIARRHFRARPPEEKRLKSA